MDPMQTDILDLAARRLGWLDRRQSVLAQNIANADTSGFQPRDLPSFAASLAGATEMAAAGRLELTRPGHMAGTAGAGILSDARPTGPDTGAQGVDGNGVALDEELTRVADTQNQQALATGLYSKYLGLFRLALGRG
ncbi:flagellar basal body rod protein FlgB [Acidisphaera rubrifaciens]|uniref:Flagellar basal-body rod protein FlgB n=1 Tax=Acidisphaera rubrifaciens HS-AP3 TaxID=1231350 RepID=A0A0D6PAP3_9PROT|nr:flagellar basal body protein [Acidisphaera rubrifaciens]GAN78263.1 flagellar basal-body rod protein FlgB [Acidisphaera rubrifaciens HS-AP3]